MKSTKSLSPHRLHLLDEYRGFVILNMIAYHTTWDLVYLFGHRWQWYMSEVAYIWQQFICWSFILLSGFCWQMSRNHFQRGLLVFGGGIVITAATLLFMPDSQVIFGILTLLGSAMLLMIPCHPLLQKIPPILGSIGAFLLFLLTRSINDGVLGMGSLDMITLPREWYANLLTTYIGLPEPGFYSTDYFSIFPWFFLFVTGYFFYGIYKAHERVPKKILLTSICPPLGWIGRHSLIIYMLHQPIVYGLLYLLLWT